MAAAYQGPQALPVHQEDLENLDAQELQECRVCLVCPLRLLVSP